MQFTYVWHHTFDFTSRSKHAQTIHWKNGREGRRCQLTIADYAEYVVSNFLKNRFGCKLTYLKPDNQNVSDTHLSQMRCTLTCLGPDTMYAFDSGTQERAGHPKIMAKHMRSISGLTKENRTHKDKDRADEKRFQGRWGRAWHMTGISQTNDEKINAMNRQKMAGDPGWGTSNKERAGQFSGPGAPGYLLGGERGTSSLCSCLMALALPCGFSLSVYRLLDEKFPHCG